MEKSHSKSGAQADRHTHRHTDSGLLIRNTLRVLIIPTKTSV